MCYNPCKFDYR